MIAKNFQRFATNKMRRVFVLTALFLASAIVSFGQQPRPTPPQDEPAVVKITTALIQLDVVVTDKKGKMITDLRPDEIEIYENGEKQKITGFSFVSSVRVTEARAKPSNDPNFVPEPPKVLKADQVRRTIALVVDDLSLSFESIDQTRRALKKFVDEQMQEGDLVAIVRTGAGVGALQQFTADKRMLYAAIERVKWNPVGSSGISAFAPIEPNSAENLRAAGDESVTDEMIAEEAARVRAFNDFRANVFASGTIGAIKYVVSGMSGLPGRKSVVLFSDGFKLMETDKEGFRQSGMVLQILEQLVDLANRASVVFYSVDPRGLQTLGLTAADKISDVRPDSIIAKISERRQQLEDTQDGLKYLAKETGGFAVINSNDLSGGVRRILDDQSYYLLAYQPDTDSFDAAKRMFNKLEVRVNRPGVNVRYRSGFFNVAEAPAVIDAPEKKTMIDRLGAALTSPFEVNGISLRLNALFGNDAKSGPFVRSLLHVDSKDLKFETLPDGRMRAGFSVLAASFGDNGQIVDQLGKSYTLTVKPEEYKKFLADGFVYNFTFPVRKPGAYQYRVALYDPNSERSGSASQFIEVPDLARNRLTLSSIVLENLSADQWTKISDPNGGTISSDPMADTALRLVKRGTVLRYGYEIYNAKLGPTKQPGLRTRIRVFREGRLVTDGVERPFDTLGQQNMLQLRGAGAIAVGAKMEPGDYVLQIIVTDTLAKSKRQIAAQFVPFEVIE